MIRFNPDNLRREFARRADLRRVEFELSEKRFSKEQSEKLEVEEEGEFLALAQSVIQATAENIARFEQRLTEYEELTVRQIIELRERLDKLLEEREVLLENAYTLPDGTRVFKSTDGVSVFDIDGNRVSRDVIDPSMIGDDKTSWEAFSANKNLIEQTNIRLNEALEFQEELDDMREQLDKDGLTAGELDDLEQRLERSVPMSIRIRQTDLEADGEPPKATPEFTAAASNKINLDTLQMDAPGLGGYPVDRHK